jgi:hypothetical protein
MKTLLDFKPLFDPTTKTLDFSLLPDFGINKLFAVINVTRNTPLYIPGASGFGITSSTNSVLTLSCDTTGHSSSDILNVYYSIEAPMDNRPVEKGGNLQEISETLQQILTELQVHSIIFLDHFHRNSLTVNDLQKIREDINNIDVITND